MAIHTLIISAIALLLILRNVNVYRKFCKKHLSKETYRELIEELPDTIFSLFIAVFLAFTMTGDAKQAYDYYLTDETIAGMTFKLAVGIVAALTLFWKLKTRNKKK